MMSAPVRYTCGEIDSIIADTKEIVKFAEAIEELVRNPPSEEELDTIRNYCTDIINLAWYKDSEMEDIRSANSELRDYGEEEESRAEDLENECAVLEERIRDLENENEELSNQNQELQERIAF